MKLLATALFIGLLASLSVFVYDAGYNASRRECPPAQQDQRLLRSEQMPGALLCYYATYWEGYGRRITVQKVTQ